MTDLVIMKDRQAVTSSLNVAENFENVTITFLEI